MIRFFLFLIYIFILSGCINSKINVDKQIEFKKSIDSLKNQVYIGKLLEYNDIHFNKPTYFFNDVLIEVKADSVYFLNYQNVILKRFYKQEIDIDYLNKFINIRENRSIWRIRD